MKAVVKEERNAPKIADEGGEGGHGNRRGYRRGARRLNNVAGGGSSGNTPNAKYPTRNKDLPENLVFDNTGHNDAANFQRTLKGLANFLHTTYSAEVATAVLKMQAVNIALEDEPTPRTDAAGNEITLTAWDIHKWKEEYNAQLKTLKVYNDSMPKAYIHLYNQCSTNLKNDLEAAPAFAQVESNKDPIGLLKLIQGLCCSYDSKTQSVMATVASHKKLFTFFQRDGMDNSSFHREFIALVKTIETYGGHGAIGITPTFVAQKLHDMQATGTCVNATLPTAAELTVANSSVREEFLAALMLSGANRDRSALSVMNWPTNSRSATIFIPSLPTNVSPCSTVGSITYPVPLVGLPDLLLVSNLRPRRMKRSFLPKTLPLRHLRLVSRRLMRHLKTPRLLVRSPVAPKFE